MPCARGPGEQLHALRCDGHHEMSDLGADGEPVHGDAASVEPVWPHQRGWSALAWMEEIMTKTTHNAEVTELSLEELESVSGGVEQLVHERLHVANKTECWIFDLPGADFFMQCFR